MSEEQISAEQRVWEYLAENGGVSIATIASGLSISPRIVRLALENLESRGLVERWFPPFWGVTRTGKNET